MPLLIARDLNPATESTMQISNTAPAVPSTNPSNLPHVGLGRVVACLLLALLAEASCLVAILGRYVPDWVNDYRTAVFCGLIGGVGGIVYCLRAVYLNACVKRSWDAAWLPWYCVRPVVSLVCGFASYALLKAGLLVLDSAPKSDGSQYGFFVLAFIAGLNVDKFVSKIEDVAQTAWGIEKSRASAKDDDVTKNVKSPGA